MEALFENDHEVQRQLDARKRADIWGFIIKSIEKMANDKKSIETLVAWLRHKGGE